MMMNSRPSPYHLSIILPCFNEGEHLAQFVNEIKKTLQSLTPSYEIIIVNDGSSDNTDQIAKKLINEGNICYLEFSRNFGKEAALMAGIDHAEGDGVVLIDADFQHPLEKLLEMASLWQSGYDMIYGVISNRANEKIIKRLGTSFFYSLMSSSEVRIPPNAGDFRWLDRKVVTALRQLPERNRFMKGLYAWVGFKSIPITFIPHNRQTGKSSYKLKKLFNLAISGLTSFTTLPLKMWTFIGGVISILAIVYGAYIAIDTLFFGNRVSGFPTLSVALMLFSGIQLLSIGILGEYISSIFNEVKRRPLYLINEQIKSSNL